MYDDTIDLEKSVPRQQDRVSTGRMRPTSQAGRVESRFMPDFGPSGNGSISASSDF